MKGADFILDCGVSWLLRVQKSCGSPQAARTTPTCMGSALEGSQVSRHAILRGLAHFRDGEMEVLVE